MGRPARTWIAAALATALAAGLGACGGEDAELLPGDTAREITANLESVQQLADEGDCVGAEGASTQVSEQIEGLGGVDPRLKEALRKGATRLNEVVAECEEEEEEVEPAEVPTIEEEPSEPTKKEEKEAEKEAKDQEKAERKEEKTPPPAAAPPADEKAPPETTEPAPPEEETPPSGGVEPASPVETEDGEDD
jgi:hypothetical protein